MTSAPVRDPLSDHLITPQNAAFLLIDYQPSQLGAIQSMDRTLLLKNAVSFGQMLGGSVGTSLLNSIFAAAVASYLAAHLAAARIIGRQALTGLALVHGYDTGFWWIAGIFAAGAVVSGALLRRGPLGQNRAPSPADGWVRTAQAEAGREQVR